MTSEKGKATPGPEYDLCTCGHFEHEHAGRYKACTVCTCNEWDWDGGGHACRWCKRVFSTERGRTLHWRTCAERALAKASKKLDEAGARLAARNAGRLP